MPLFQVRPGRELPHEGQLLPAGARVDLPRAVGADCRDLVEEIDATGCPIDLTVELDWSPAVRDAAPERRAVVLEETRDRLTAVLAGALDAEVLARSAAEQLVAQRAEAVARARAAVAAVEAEIQRVATPTRPTRAKSPKSASSAQDAGAPATQE